MKKSILLFLLLLILLSSCTQYKPNTFVKVINKTGLRYTLDAQKVTLQYEKEDICIVFLLNITVPLYLIEYEAELGETKY